MENNLTIEKLLDALDSVCWYNGYAQDRLLKIREEIMNCDDPYCYRCPHEWNWNDEGFQVIWMILVCLYGDYGTSPRGGWILTENKKEVIEFIDSICATQLHHNRLVAEGFIEE